MADRTCDGPLNRDSRNEPTHSVPNDGEPWSVDDILGEMMAGAYAHGARVDLFGYPCYNSTIGGELANLWTVYPIDTACRDQCGRDHRETTRSTMTRNHPDQPAVEEIVEEHRETFELVADGDDEAARMAQNILDEADN